MRTNWKKMADNASSRSHIYGLLATVFRQEPSAALVEELRSSQMKEVFGEMEIELGQEFHSTPALLVADVLAEEFTRLFLGPGRHISAHESIFAEVDGDSGSLWGATTVEVKKFIETTGLAYDPEYTGIPDHVSVEFEFMQRLSAWEADQWRQKHRGRAEYCADVQRRFLDRHLFRWLPQFMDAVITEATVPFYRSMAELSKNFVLLERASFVEEAAA